MKKFIKNVFVITFICGIIFIFYLYFTLPDISQFDYNKHHATIEYMAIEQDGDVLIGSQSDKNILPARYEDIPQALLDAVVAVEDKRYYSHFGVDMFSIGRAFYVNIKAGEIIEGGSTITQQTVTMLFFEKDLSFIRKMKEAMSAILFERRYSKQDILTMYLNEIYLGEGAHGIRAAAQTYFSKDISELSLAECATIAGIIQAPSAYAPTSDKGYEYARQRKERVLRLMRDQGKISMEEYAQAMAEEIKIVKGSQGTFPGGGTCVEGYDHFIVQAYDQAKMMITNYYREEKKYSQAAAGTAAETAMKNYNITINTSISRLAQNSALKYMRETLQNYDEINSAFVYLDSDNGNVVAYYGSDTYLDLADAPQMPGSTIKPLYYAYLLDSGIVTPTTIVNDEQGFADDTKYSPKNAGEYKGWVNMREALVSSLNVASLRFFLMEDNQANIVDYLANNLGITTMQDSDKRNHALALGGMARGISPIELSQAYAAINNGGMLYEANFVLSVRMYDNPDEPAAYTLITSQDPAYRATGLKERVIKESTCNLLKDYLQSIVLRGTATGADTGYATGGKTGTTDNYKDVWFVGSTSRVTGAIWVGQPSTGTEKLLSSLCSSIYKNTILAIAADNVVMSGANLPSKRDESQQDLLPVYILNSPHTQTRYRSITSSSVNELTLTLADRKRFEDADLVVEKVVLCEQSSLEANSACPRVKTIFLREEDKIGLVRCSEHSNSTSYP